MLNIDNIVCLDQEVKKERYRKFDVRVSKKKQTGQDKRSLQLFWRSEVKVYLGKSKDPTEEACSALL